MSIDTLATFLLLPYIRNNYVLLAKEARAKDYSYEQFLEQLLQGETDQRRNNSLYKRIRKARFPYQMELGDFKTEHLSTELKRKIKQLENLEFIRNRENIILVGNPGTGKTALSIALGMKACREYRNVLFI
ncbi:MAG: ATP-binding protein, partial [Parasporobacterium sp.]|nr:ATP-binding protein [Parasporobacterium sp.]